LYAILNDYSVKTILKLFPRPESALSAEKLSGEAKTGEQLPDLNLWFSLQLAEGEPITEVIDRLNGLDIIEIAFPVPSYTLAADIDPPTADFIAKQGYLLPAPEGIDVAAVHNFAGGLGEDVRVVDMELGWTWDHEDLKLPFYHRGGQNVPVSSIDHGTSVLGIMVGQHNGYGVNGICPEVQIGGNSISRPDQQVAAVVNEITAALREGDFYLFEVARQFQGKSSPMEVSDDIFDAIKTASANGKILIEAAGNGNSNLDDSLYGGRFNPKLRHSGAIMVGAGAPPSGNYGPDRCRLDFSNYGERVDVQGWGREVMTTGVCVFDTLFFPNEDPRQGYTAKFAGTSSATPIVTGAAACLQGVYKKRYPGRVLTGEVIRNLLVTTGTAQQEGPNPGNIGPRPNLKKAVKLLPDMSVIVVGSVADVDNHSLLSAASITFTFLSDIHPVRILATDENGEFNDTDFPANTPFSMTVSAKGYKDSTLADLSCEPDELLVLDLKVLRQELSVDETVSNLTIGECFPNPFNHTIQIPYSVPQSSSPVTLTVYDLSGAEVALLVTGTKTAGTYTATFDARQLPSGLYIVSLQIGMSTLNRKIVLLK